MSLSSLAVFRSQPLWLIAMVTLLFAVVARLLRAVSLTGALAGWVVSILLYVGAGPGGLVVLVVLFTLTWGATRLGYKHKQILGTAERKDGRSAWQILANVGIAAACAVVNHWHTNTLLLVAMCATLGEAAADTVASEIGQISSHEARLITNWRRVPAGTDGAISVAGTLAGTSAALLVALTGNFTGLIDHQGIVVSFIAACSGMICDSYLGAALESRKLLCNNTVNLLGTLTAAFVAVLLAIVL